MIIFRLIFGYLPGNAVSAAVSFAIVMIFTRYLEPAEYGRYALVLATVHLVDVCFLQWLRLGQLRYYESAVKEGTLEILLSTTYVALGLVALVVGALFFVGALYFPMVETLRLPMLFGGGLFILRVVVRQNLDVHRAAFRATRFSVLECSRALLGLAFAIFLVVWLGLAELGLVLGLAMGLGVVAVFDGNTIYKKVSVAAASTDDFIKFLRYGFPLTLSFALVFIISTSDRYLLQYFLGSDSVGVYSASYGLAQNSIAMIFMLVTSAAFPLAVKALERGGVEAAHRQLKENGIVLLAFGFPAMVGLVLVSRPMAEVLLGTDFRAAADDIIPWIAVSGFIAGLKTHYFDHSFHLGQRTGIGVWTNLPPAVVNIVLNVVLIPLYGLMGAVYSTVAAFGLGLVLSIVLGRRVFPVPFPVEGALRVVLATVPMALTLLFVRFPPGLIGLTMMVVVGAAVCALFYVLLDVADTRRYLVMRLRKYTAKN